MKGKSKKISVAFMKALGMFGSIEALKMLCSVVRNKLVALWIGAAGVGVISLYNATLEFLKSIALLNLRQSAVPAIATASDEGARSHLCRYVDILGLIIGIVATIAVIVFSPLLSWLTFDSYEYSWGFAMLAPTMLASSIGDARTAILQGLGKLRTIAKASLWSSLASTAVAIPLFYFFRMSAIVPVLIVFPVFTALFVLIAPEGRLTTLPFNAELFRSTVKSLIKLGSALAIGLGVGLAADYALRVYLSWQAGVDTVGIFQAGYTIVKSYVGVFFIAITVEFFPRLSATIDRKSYTSLIVAHEVVLSAKILAPLIFIFIILSDYVVSLLYSASFSEAVPYVVAAVLGSFLRAASVCFSYVIIAKGDGKVYIFTESVSAVSLLVFSYFGWRWGGYAGLGWAYVCQYTVFTAVTWAVCRWRYRLRLPASLWQAVIGGTLVGALAFAIKILWL